MPGLTRSIVSSSFFSESAAGVVPEPRCDLLAAGSELVQAVEALGVDGGVAVDELVLELVRDGLRLQLQHGGLDVLDVAAGRGDVLVDVGVAAEDLQRRRDLGEGRRALRPGVADVEEGGRGHRVLAVVGEGVAGDVDERQHIQDARLLDDGLDDALEDDIVGELCAFGEREGHGGSLLLVNSGCARWSESVIPGRFAAAHMRLCHSEPPRRGIPERGFDGKEGTVVALRPSGIPRRGGSE